MLNGDAHHSLTWDVEPRILPLLSCQRRCIVKRQHARRKQKNRKLGWPWLKGPQSPRMLEAQSHSADSWVI
jgi:hypothetical protein